MLIATLARWPLALELAARLGQPGLVLALALALALPVADGVHAHVVLAALIRIGLLQDAARRERRQHTAKDGDRDATHARPT